MALPTKPSMPDVGKRLDLNLLTVFDMVMTERHVSRAAERLGMTQSAVSNALNRLRLVFQDRLFVKAARGVDPTPKALELWPPVHQALTGLQLTLKPQSFNPSSAVLRFRIAMVDITVALLSPHLLRLTYPKSPNTSLFFVPFDPALTGASLMRGELDFCVGIDPPRASVLETIKLWSDSFCVVGRRGHPLLKSSLTIEAFCSTPQLAVNEPGDWNARNVIDVALEDLGLKRNVVMSVNQFVVVPDILQRMDTIAVMPSRLAQAPNVRTRLSVQPMPVDIPNVTIYLSWHRRNNESAPHIWMKQGIVDAAAAMVANFDDPRNGSWMGSDLRVNPL